jgi:hypothetical protein
MLQFSTEQLRSFEGNTEIQFQERLARYVRTEHGDVLVRHPGRSALVWHLDEQVLRELIYTGSDRSREYGLTSEASIAAFVTLMFVAAPNFCCHPAVHGALFDYAVPERGRFELMWRRTTDGNWNEIALAYDPAAWIRKHPF